MQTKFVKRENAADLVMIFMIWALFSLLVTRFLLQLFGWPTISFGVWHIAHVIWGGVFMLIGLIILLTGYGEKTRKSAAAISGIGWGLFIDEIGKYLTKDNDYWFKPAIIFIYISFVAIFLVYRYFEKTNRKNTETLLYSTINQLEAIPENSFDNFKKKKMISNLNEIIRSKTDKKIILMAKNLKILLEKTKTEKTENFNVWVVFFGKIRHFFYKTIFENKLTLVFLGTYSAFYAADKFSETFKILTNPIKIHAIQKFYSDYDFLSKTDFYMISFKIFSDVIVSTFFILGLIMVASKRRVKGLNFFQYGLLVNIFFTSVFRFYFEQFSGVFSLGISILLLSGIARLKKEKKF